MAKILVPSGMGDIYWILTKMESFKEVEKLDRLDFYIYDTGDGLGRSVEFVKRFKIADSVQFTPSNIKRITHNLDFMKEQFHGDYRYAILKPFYEYDYLIWFNNLMVRGIPLDIAFPQYKVNWYPEMFFSGKEDSYGKRAKREIGDYVIVYFTSRGHYASWFEHVSMEQWYNILLRIHKKTGCKMVLTGKHWDTNDHDKLKSFDVDEIFYDLTDKTSVDQLFGLIKNARAYIGFQAGNAMMSVIFHIPTFVIYNRYNHFNSQVVKGVGQIHKDFYSYSLPPDTLYKYQFPIFVDENFSESAIIDHPVFS